MFECDLLKLPFFEPANVETPTDQLCGCKPIWFRKQFKLATWLFEVPSKNDNTNLLPAVTEDFLHMSSCDVENWSRF